MFLSFRNASLTETITAGDENSARDLLAAGADVNQVNLGGQTPLILAIVSGQLRLIPLLLDAGADPWRRDNTGLNAVEWAERKGLPDVAKLLISRVSTARAPRIESPVNRSNVPEKLAESDEQTRQAHDVARSNPLSSDEKSRRWIAGLKQRLDEKAGRSQSTATDLPPKTDPQPELKANQAQRPSGERPSKSSQRIEKTTRVPDARETAQEKSVEQRKSAPLATEQKRGEPPSEPTDSLPAETSSSSSSRKRCPECNAVYNSPLLAYCAYHVVPLVDIDAPVIVPQTGNRKTVLLWSMIILTFVGAVFTAYLLFRPLYEGEKKVASSVSPTTSPGTQQGVPVAGGQLKGKTVDLPFAETTSKVEAPEVIVIRIKVDKSGHVYSVQGSRGNEQLRRAALEAARKATFSSDKLRGREAEGTISYTFNP